MFNFGFKYKLNDLKNNIPINNIDEGLAECFKEKEIEALNEFIKNNA